MDIIKTILADLPKVISNALFEGANIVLYTDDMDFFKNGEQQIKAVVNKIKKRIELRADEKILLKPEIAEKEIRNILNHEAEVTEIIFDIQRSMVIIEAKKPGVVIGKQGSVLNEIKNRTFWTPVVQRSPAIESKITDNIREVLYENNNYRKRFLNATGKSIYKEWNPEKVEMWIRVTFLGGGRQVGRSCLLLQTPNSKIIMDCGINPAANTDKEKFPYLDISDFDIHSIDAIILSHAHLDHSGVIPYLYKMGYKGPIYMTAPTRDIASLLALDFIGVSYKQATAPLYSSKDIKEMVKHSITLDYNEVTDITPDLRLTLYNSGHCLGSSMVHLNIGNGLHNLLYTGDFKYGKSRLLDQATTNFHRLETAIIESTYGGKDNVLPPRKEQEEKLIDLINKTIERKGKVLIPELGLGRSQETMLILEDAITQGKLPNIPVYIDGMIWDINAIHTAYPDFLNPIVRNQIFQDKNPFVSKIFKRVGSAQERKEVIEGGPCVVLATSGMLVGGASVEYLKHFSENKRNAMVFVCYQPAGGLGRQLQDGDKQIKMNVEGKDKMVKILMDIHTIEGFTGHSGRNELLNFINHSNPRPKRVIINHGESSKSIDLASSIYKLNRIETTVPRNLETIRIR
ncbi:MAG: beta-CASP ribonuclease aCPSF1 [Nanoarchaeota archaeon]|nr:beta-CASP ribonuclease aCPSF1 [Nanoarchaeota archaeon]